MSVGNSNFMTNYDFDETALSETIDFTAFLKMNCIRIPSVPLRF